MLNNITKAGTKKSLYFFVIATINQIGLSFSAQNGIRYFITRLLSFTV